jgi:hypothetical protein
MLHRTGDTTVDEDWCIVSSKAFIGFPIMVANCCVNHFFFVESRTVLLYEIRSKGRDEALLVTCLTVVLSKIEDIIELY